MIRLPAALLPMFLTAACSAPVVHITRNDDAVVHPAAEVSTIVPGEVVVVVKADSAPDDDDGFTDCVRASMAGEKPTFRIMPEKEFRESLFPWLEEQAVSAERISALLEKLLVRNRIKELRVRYIIIVNGATTSELRKGAASGGSSGSGAVGAYAGGSGAMLCGAGPGGAGCLGLLVWQRMSDLSAVVWDLKTGSETGSVAVHVSGTNIVPAYVIPVPLIAPTESAACVELGVRLTRFITTGETGE